MIDVKIRCGGCHRALATATDDTITVTAPSDGRRPRSFDLDGLPGIIVYCGRRCGLAFNSTTVANAVQRARYRGKATTTLRTEDALAQPGRAL